MSPSDFQRQAQFTRHFSENERAMQAFAFSLVPNRADVEDIMQEALAALWEKFADYDPERPFLPWANRFVYRQVQIHRRKHAIRQKYMFSEETLEQLAGDEPISAKREEAMSHALDQCLTKLSDSQRNLVNQRYLAKGSLQDLAKESGRNVDALYKSLERIRNRLYDCIHHRLAQEGFGT